ncbi:hypothetical protein DFH11DRAFT_1543412 [Phellopilus nigrolimitatus]|nr:hypothetical protein DFH11DRAFT_1543412 [Phellopilus nigrolimitatus]
MDAPATSPIQRSPSHPDFVFKKVERKKKTRMPSTCPAPRTESHTESGVACSERKPFSAEPPALDSGARVQPRQGRPSQKFLERGGGTELGESRLLFFSNGFSAPDDDERRTTTSRYLAMEGESKIVGEEKKGDTKKRKRRGTEREKRFGWEIGKIEQSRGAEPYMREKIRADASERRGRVRRRSKRKKEKKSGFQWQWVGGKKEKNAKEPIITSSQGWVRLAGRSS